jgi:hypothetical protein
VDGEVLAVLVDEGIGGVPDPPQAIALGRGSVEQLNVVEDRLGGIFKENLTVTILQENREEAEKYCNYYRIQRTLAVLIVVIAKTITEFKAYTV